MYLTDLTEHEVELLTCILQVLPAENPVTYSNRVLTLSSLLPPDLKRPNRLRGLILPPQSSFTTLCPLHKPLDACLIHAIFQLLSLEAGVRLNSMVANSTLLNFHQQSYIMTIRQLHGLWLPVDVYEKTFLAPKSTKWSLQEDGCEACMLARMAGDLDVLLCLRLSMVSRTHKQSPSKHAPPILLRWVEAWLALLTDRHLKMDSADFGRLMDHNDEEAENLKGRRKQYWRERRHGHGNMYITRSGAFAADRVVRTEIAGPTKEWSDHANQEPCHGPTQVFGHEGPSDHDAVISVIDHYAALLSTTHLPLASVCPCPPFDPPHAEEPAANTCERNLHLNEQSSVNPENSNLTATSYSEQWYHPHNQAEAYADIYRDLLSTPPFTPVVSTADIRGMMESPPSPSAWTDASLPRTSYRSLLADVRISKRPESIPLVPPVPTHLNSTTEEPMMRPSTHSANTKPAKLPHNHRNAVYATVPTIPLPSSHLQQPPEPIPQPLLTKDHARSHQPNEQDAARLEAEQRHITRETSLRINRMNRSRSTNTRHDGNDNGASTFNPIHRVRDIDDSLTRSGSTRNHHQPSSSSWISRPTEQSFAQSGDTSVTPPTAVSNVSEYIVPGRQTGPSSSSTWTRIRRALSKKR